MSDVTTLHNVLNDLISKKLLAPESYQHFSEVTKELEKLRAKCAAWEQECRTITDRLYEECSKLERAEKRIIIYEQRVEALEKREKEITRLEVEHACTKEAKADIFKLVEAIFRSPIVKESICKSENINNNTGYHSSNASVTTRREIE